VSASNAAQPAPGSGQGRGRSQEGTFVFLSQLLGSPVTAPGGARLGRLADLLCEVCEESYPRIRALRVKTGRQLRRVEWEDVESCEPGEVRLRRADALRALILPPPEIPLAQDVLDKQVIDTDDAKVERVNDLHLLRARGDLRVAHVDVGFRGLVRRMSWEPWVDGLVRLVSPRSPYLARDQFVPWKHVRPLAVGSQRVKLDVARRSMEEMHPADLAEILGELDRRERAVLFRELPVEAAADALEVTEPGLQRELIKMVEPERAADLLEAMQPDAAADLLDSLPRDESRELLQAMEPEEKREVEQLLSWPEDAAGGMMTPVFLRLRPSMTAGQALAEIKAQAEGLPHLHDAFVLGSEGKLVGTVGLRQVLLAAADEPLVTVMTDTPASVEPSAPFNEVTQLAQRYKLLAVPVATKEGRMLGVITIDDVLSRVLRG
jgi:CBS domain-containing protein